MEGKDQCTASLELEPWSFSNSSKGWECHQPNLISEASRIRITSSMAAHVSAVKQSRVKSPWANAAGICASALEILEERVPKATRTRRQARARKLSLLR